MGTPSDHHPITITILWLSCDFFGINKQARPRSGGRYDQDEANIGLVHIEEKP